MIRLLLTLFCAAAIFAGCNDDDNSGGTDGSSDSQFEQNLGSSVSRDFVGQVVDRNNNPVSAATVKIGSSTVMTDSNGIFSIKDASVKQKFAYITVDKTGYFQGSRSLVPTTGKNSVRIMLVPNVPTATVSSGQPSEVTTDSGTKIMFDGAFEDENGNPYNGNVSVSVFHLQPSDNNIDQLMPGMLYAERENSNEAVLQTFGMINVELRGNGGQIIQPAQGHPAGIEVSIDNSQMASAPATIPLWHFDAAKGWWKEDGVAIRQGNKYVGEASHFSWWNCDAPFPTVSLNLTVLNAEGNPVANTQIVIFHVSASYGTSGYTDEQGHVSGLVPANAQLEIYVQTPCGTNRLITAIGPLSADATQVINLPPTGIQSVTIEGKLVTCAGANVTNGYVAIRYPNSSTGFTFVGNDGSFSFTTVICANDLGDSFKLLGVDFETLQATDSIAYTFTTPVTNVGNLQACGAVTEFISYQVDNDPTVFIVQEVQASIDQYLGISGWNEGNTANGQSLFISGSVTAAGTYTTAQFTLEGTLGYITNNTPNDLQFHVTQIGAVGEFIDMTFNGTFEDDAGQTHTLTGVAHAIRIH